MIGDQAVQLLGEVPVGTRLVVRYRLDDAANAGATDALGYLRSRTSETCLLDTPRGLVTINFHDVIAAKPIPEPPARRRTPQPVALD
jgi:hypothetical protein